MGSEGSEGSDNMLWPGGGGGRPQKEGLDGRGWYQAWVAATGMFGSATDHALVTFVESSYMHVVTAWLGLFRSNLTARPRAFGGSQRQPTLRLTQTMFKSLACCGSQPHHEARRPYAQMQDGQMMRQNVRTWRVPSSSSSSSSSSSLRPGRSARRPPRPRRAGATPCPA